MSEIVPVALGERSYDIHVGSGLLAQSAELLAPFAHSVVPVVTDENVAALHLNVVLDSLHQRGIAAQAIILPAGETTKSFSGFEQLCRDLLRLGVDRKGLIVALGGGVIGDLAGFAAGVLKRGVAFAQIPTTLLAQVDSSVGGKTSIDVPEGKNLIGVFHQPRIVIADGAVLSTLPRRELLAGYAEVVKYAALGDAAFFDWLDANGSAALDSDASALSHMVAHCCRMKAGIVSRDETESGERALLNLGHSFGHALEAAAGYSGALLHGEAVAIGMVLAFRLSEHLGLSAAANTERLIRHLAAAGLRTEVAQLAEPPPDPDSLLEFMRRDKKAKGGKLNLVLVRGIGKSFLAADVPADAVKAVLAR